jgi:hypothetical protein
MNEVGEQRSRRVTSSFLWIVRVYEMLSSAVGYPVFGGCPKGLGVKCIVVKLKSMSSVTSGFKKHKLAIADIPKPIYSHVS